MKVGRQYTGKVVEITWRDPHGADRMEVAKMPVGYHALSTWREYGVIDNVTDGVVRLIQSRAENPPYKDEREEEAVPSYVHEALIEKIVIFEPSKEEVPTS